MATNTYTPLATITLTGTDSEVVFASIPSGYRDLILIADQKNMSGNGIFGVQFNSDQNSNYSTVSMYADPSVGSEAATRVYIKASVSNVTSNEIMTLQVMDYSTSDKHKTVLLRSGQAGTNIQAAAARWASTSPITSIRLYHTGTNVWGIGSSFSLYGVIA